MKDEFLSMFKFKALLFLEEAWVVLAAPFVLCVSLPMAAADLLAFVRDRTADVEGIGSVCAYSLFDLARSDTHSPTATRIPNNRRAHEARSPRLSPSHLSIKRKSCGVPQAPR